MDILSNPAEAHRADPHAGCCGGWGLNAPGYPLGTNRQLLTNTDAVGLDNPQPPLRRLGLKHKQSSP